MRLWATYLTFCQQPLLEEESDIMFQRIRDTLRKERQLVAETKDEVYKEVADWNQRRLEAESRGEAFNEPVSRSDRPARKKRKFLFCDCFLRCLLHSLSSLEPDKWQR